MGKSILEISGELNVHRTSVGQWIIKERLIDNSLRDLPTARDMLGKRHKAIELFKMGKSTIEISRELNVTRGTVHLWTKKALASDASSSGLPLRLLYGKLSDKRRRVIELFKTGESITHISREVDTRRSSVVDWIENGRVIDPSLSSLPIFLFSQNMAEKRKKVIKQLKIGKSMKEICGELNVKRTTLGKWIQTERAIDKSLSELPKNAPAENMSELRTESRRLFKAGISPAEIFDQVKKKKVLRASKITLKAFLASKSSPSSSEMDLSKEQYAEKKRKAVIGGLHKSSCSGQSYPYSMILVPQQEDVEKDKKVTKLLAEVMKQAEMAQSLGISHETFKKWLVVADSSHKSSLFSPSK